MKITVQKKKIPKKSVDWKKLPYGTVVKAEIGDRAIVYYDFAVGPALLLFAPGTSYHLHKAAGRLLAFENCEVIGKITEIIVEEE